MNTTSGTLPAASARRKASGATSSAAEEPVPDAPQDERRRRDAARRAAGDARRPKRRGETRRGTSRSRPSRGPVARTPRGRARAPPPATRPAGTSRRREPARRPRRRPRAIRRSGSHGSWKKTMYRDFALLLASGASRRASADAGGQLSATSRSTTSGCTRRRRPCDRAAPVVPDDDRAFAPERFDEPGHVADERADVVRPAQLRLAVPAQVGRDGPVPGRGERGELVAPRARELGKAVQEQDERAVARPGGEGVERGSRSRRASSSSITGLSGRMWGESSHNRRNGHLALRPRARSSVVRGAQRRPPRRARARTRGDTSSDSCATTASTSSRQPGRRGRSTSPSGCARTS